MAMIMAFCNTPASWQTIEIQLSLQQNVLEDSSRAAASTVAISARA